MIDRDESSLRRDCSPDASNSPEFKKDVEAKAIATQGRKKVSFAPTAKVRQIAKIPKDVVSDYWFTNEDFSRMKKSFAPTVQRMMNGTLSKDLEEQNEDYCTRGLEYRTRDGAKRRMKNKYDGMAAVLHEQDRQTFEETPDDELLARAYREANFHCISEAKTLGEQDALNVQLYLSTDNEPFYDAAAIAVDEAVSAPVVSKRGKLSPKGSFHGRGLRAVKRVFSGKKIRINAVPVA